MYYVGELFMKRILITGAKGMLGEDLSDYLLDKCEVIKTDVEELDITDLDLCIKTVREIKPEFIINCAAYTLVDKAEEEQEKALAINSKGARNIAIASQEIKAHLISIGTDYIFDGLKGKPYVEDDLPHPINFYGASKLKGEEEIKKISTQYTILRISWLFNGKRRNFFTTILDLMKREKILNAVDDEISTPTYTIHLCQQIEKIIEKGCTGIYHSSNEGYCSRYEYALEIIKSAKIKDVNVIPVETGYFKLLAKRPPFSALENKRLKDAGLNIMPDWKSAVGECLKMV